VAQARDEALAAGQGLRHTGHARSVRLRRAYHLTNVTRRRLLRKDPRDRRRRRPRDRPRAGSAFSDDSAAHQLPTITGDVTNGFVATLTVGVSV
jgi:hypothetical protein